MNDKREIPLPKFAQPTIPSEEDWELFRPTILQLYLEDGFTLREVRARMLDEFNFRATDKMFKNRFTRWRVAKNFKTTNVLDALGHMAAFRGTNGYSADDVVVCGRVMSAEKLQSHLKRGQRYRDSLLRAPRNRPTRVSAVVDFVSLPPAGLGPGWFGSDHSALVGLHTGLVGFETTFPDIISAVVGNLGTTSIFSPVDTDAYAADPDRSLGVAEASREDWQTYPGQLVAQTDTAAEDWQDHRPFLEQLYVVENLKLEDVMRILETIFGFVATEEMYKTKIIEWGLMNKAKVDDENSLPRASTERRETGENSHQLAFRRPAANLRRFNHLGIQPGINRDVCSAVPDLSASHDVQCLWPVHGPEKGHLTFDPERPFSTASKNGRIELILFQTNAYHRSRFASPEVSTRLDGTTQLSTANSAQDNEALEYNIKWESKLINGMRSLVQHKTAHGWRMLGETCEMFHKVLDHQSQGLLNLLLFAFSDHQWALHPDLRSHVLRFFTKASALRLGCNHPMTIVLYHLQDQHIFSDAVAPAFELLLEVLGRTLGPAHEEVWRIKDNYCSMLRRRQAYAAAEFHGLHFLNECEAIFGRLHWRTRCLLLELGDVHHLQGLHETAECIYEEILLRGRQDLRDDFPDESCIYALQHLALIWEDRRDYAQSEACWRDMLVGAKRAFGLEDERTTQLVVLLEKSFERRGIDPEVWLQQNFGISCV